MTSEMLWPLAFYKGALATTSVTAVIVLQFPFLVIRSARFKLKNTIKNKSELSALGCDVGEPWIGVRGRNCVP